MSGATRAGRTGKISVSLDLALLERVRARARRLHRGNLSALIGEGVARVLEDDGREALAAWLLEAHTPTAEELAAVYSEWRGESARRSKRRRGRAA
jgi:hypothetical protein